MNNPASVAEIVRLESSEVPTSYILVEKYQEPEIVEQKNEKDTPTEVIQGNIKIKGGYGKGIGDEFTPDKVKSHWKVYDAEKRKRY